MPRGDRTGPMGMGPKTGRAAGYCAGYTVPGFANPLPGAGAGFWGARGGRGWRHWFYATGLPGWLRAGIFGTSGTSPFQGAPTREQEVGALKAMLEAIQKRLDDLGGDTSE